MRVLGQLSVALVMLLAPGADAADLNSQAQALQIQGNWAAM